MEGRMQASEPRAVWELGAELGEGPIWVAQDAALWFTDIKGPKIYRLDPASGERREWSAPEPVGFVVPAAGGGFVAGLKSGPHRFLPASGEFELIAQVDPGQPGNRLNDAVTDPAGRIWFGTMDNEEKDASGSFYRFENGQVHATGFGNIVITNGPAVSPDGRTLYLVDTLAGTIEAAELHEDGEVGPSRPFVRIAPEEGHPDGPTVDSEGCVWIGLYGGWEARRYSPAGELLARVRFPVANITKLAFGGPDLKTVFATTARQFLDEEALRAQPQAGHLFTLEVDVPGVPAPVAAL